MAPTWITSQNLGQVFETDNVIIPLEADNAVSYDLIYVGDTELQPLVSNLVTKTLVINGTDVQFGSTSTGTITSQNTYSSITESTGVIAGGTFFISDLNGRDEIMTMVEALSLAVILPAIGTLTIGNPSNQIEVDVDGLMSVNDIVNAINSKTDNTTYGIGAYELGGSILLRKANNYGGNSITVTSDTSGTVDFPDSIFHMSLDQIATNINNQLSHTNNIVASVETDTASSYYLKITDNNTGISVIDSSSNINVALRLPQYSQISRDDIVTEINNETPTTNVIAELNTNVLQLIGTEMNITGKAGISNDVMSILHMDNLGSPLLSQPINEWLNIDGTTGVLKGLTPTATISTPIEINVRATAVDTSFSDRRFSLILQPISQQQQVKWSPTNIGTLSEGEVSNLLIPVENIDQIKNGSSFRIIRDLVSDFSIENYSPWLLSRASQATYINQYGRLVLVGPNEPRLEYDYETGDFKGMVIEDQKINYLSYSESASTSWTVNNLNVDLYAENSPRPAVMASKFAATTSNSTHYITQTVSMDVGKNEQMTFSIFAKAAGNDSICLSTSRSDSKYVYFNLATENITYGSGGVTAEMTKLADGWYRCSITTSTGNNSSPNTTCRAYIANGSSRTFTGDGVSGAYFWGAQLEHSDKVSSYIPTLTTQSVREKDVLTVDMVNNSYDIEIVSENGSSSETVNILTGQYTLETNDSFIKEVTIFDFPQRSVFDTMDITDSGLLVGVAPFYEAPPPSQELDFTVILTYQGQTILGPAIWSMTVENIFDNIPTNIKSKGLLNNQELLSWSNTNNIIFNDIPVYRSEDYNFGIKSRPEMDVIFNLNVTDLDQLYSGTLPHQPIEMVYGKPSYASTDDYDVVYYDLFNKECDYTINDLRSQLINNIGFEDREILPDYYGGNYTPRVIIGYVEKGYGQKAIQNFNDDLNAQMFYGNIFKISRIYGTHMDFDIWDETKTEEVIISLQEQSNPPYEESQNIISN